MTRLWTDEQEASCRATAPSSGRWSGGVFVPADVEVSHAARRPSLLAEVLRALRDIRHE